MLHSIILRDKNTHMLIVICYTEMWVVNFRECILQSKSQLLSFTLRFLFCNKVN